MRCLRFHIKLIETNMPHSIYSGVEGFDRALGDLGDPLVNDHIAGWHIPIFNRKYTSSKGPFSVAMLVGFAISDYGMSAILESDFLKLGFAYSMLGKSSKSMDSQMMEFDGDKFYNGMIWVVPLPSNSDHTDYFMFRIGDSYKQTFICHYYWEGEFSSWWF